jgi:hypothetical protein
VLIRVPRSKCKISSPLVVEMPQIVYPWFCAFLPCRTGKLHQLSRTVPNPRFSFCISIGVIGESLYLPTAITLANCARCDLDFAPGRPVPMRMIWPCSGTIAAVRPPGIGPHARCVRSFSGRAARAAGIRSRIFVFALAWRSRPPRCCLGRSMSGRNGCRGTIRKINSRTNEVWSVLRRARNW